MYDHRLYAKGVHSILLVEWSLQCQTPLLIRNGKTLVYSENTERAKTRGRDLTLQWKKAAKDGQKNNDGITEAEVAGLAYGYVIEDGQVVPYHFVPASSVRGALRSWTLRHLLHPDLRGKLIPPVGQGEAGEKVYLADLRRALENRRYGYALVASLFGLATDTRPGEDLPANAGRLTVETECFAGVAAGEIGAGGVKMGAAEGPQNARRQLRVRNPLDRITHGSKDKGLHHFLEICRRETFPVRMAIVNPLDADMGLLSLWQRELDEGLLRLGALASIGRGRVAIDRQHYTLWKEPTALPLAGMAHFQPDAAVAHQDEDEDALAGIWQRYRLPNEKLVEFRPYVEAYV